MVQTLLKDCLGLVLATGQAVGEDLGRLHRGLAEARIAHDLARHAVAIMLELLAQHLELGDQLVDLVDRIERDALQQQTKIVDHTFAVVAVVGNLPSWLRDVATHQLTNPTLDLSTDPVEAVHLTPKDTHVRSSPIVAPEFPPNLFYFTGPLTPHVSKQARIM